MEETPNDSEGTFQADKKLGKKIKRLLSDGISGFCKALWDIIKNPYSWATIAASCTAASIATPVACAVVQTEKWAVASSIISSVGTGSLGITAISSLAQDHRAPIPIIGSPNNIAHPACHLAQAIVMLAVHACMYGMDIKQRTFLILRIVDTAVCLVILLINILISTRAKEAKKESEN